MTKKSKIILLIVILIIAMSFSIKHVRKNIKRNLYYNQVGIKEIITDSNYYGFNEDVTVTFKLDKDPKYSVNSIQVNDVVYKSSDFITNTDSEISISINTGLDEGGKNYRIKSIDYSYLGMSEKNRFIFSSEGFSIYVGDINNTHYIYNVEDLKSLNVNGTNKLMADIDLTGVDFDPIEKFSGYIDGNGYKISNFTITNEDISEGVYEWGFFRHIDGFINNIHLDNVHVDTDVYDVKYYSCTGILACYNNGTITNSSVSGVLKGTKNVGGMVGKNHGVITDSFADIDVSGFENVGGLVGENIGLINNSYVEGNITGDTSVGGMAGENGENIKNSFAKVNVNGRIATGGLAGVISTYGYIYDSYVIGEVTGVKHTGGLVGFNNRCDIVNSYASVKVMGTENTGGLVGSNRGYLKNTYTTGEVKGIEKTGGLVGVSYSWYIGIEKSYSAAKVEGKGNTGGLVGQNFSVVKNSFAVGNVDGISNTGGLVGYTSKESYPKIENSYRYNNQVIKENNDITIPYDTEYEGISSISKEDLLKKKWYIKVLDFDEDIWDLTKVEEGYLPKLKSLPEQVDSRIKS